MDSMSSAAWLGRIIDASQVFCDGISAPLGDSNRSSMSSPGGLHRFLSHPPPCGCSCDGPGTGAYPATADAAGAGAVTSGEPAPHNDESEAVEAVEAAELESCLRSR